MFWDGLQVLVCSAVAVVGARVHQRAIGEPGACFGMQPLIDAVATARVVLVAMLVSKQILPVRKELILQVLAHAAKRASIVLWGVGPTSGRTGRN